MGGGRESVILVLKRVVNGCKIFGEICLQLNHFLDSRSDLAAEIPLATRC